MKPLLRAATALSLLLLAGCPRKTSVSNDERAALQKQAQTEAGQVAEAAREGAPKALAGAKISGGQIQIGDAQGRPLYRISAKEIRAINSDAGGSPTGAIALGASATLFKEGQPESSFKADTIQLFNTSKGARLQMTGRVVATSQNATGAPVEVSAPRADVDVSKRVVVASGGAIAKRGDVTLKTPSLQGQTSLQMLSCSDAVVLAPGAQIKAKSAVFNWKTNRLSAQSVSATRPDLELSGAQLDADTLASHGTFSGGVVAKGKNGTARGPRLDFNWKNDRLFVPQATFGGSGGTATIEALATDSKLRVTSAQNVRIQQNGATLTAKSARGFDNVSRLSASGVDVVRGDLHVVASSANARDWSGERGVISGSGGVTASNKTGTVRAQNATWTGSAQSGHVEASGGVEIRAAQGTLRGQNATSDGHFQNADLSGNVSGTLANGTQLRAGRLQKRGEGYVASGGASARLRDGTRVQAARVEGNQNGAVATGGASGILPDGTRMSASRVEKNGDNLLATGGASGTLADGTRLSAQRVEKRGNFVVATGNARATLPGQKNFGRLEVSAARVEGPLDKSALTASGGVVLRAQNGAVVRAPRAVYNRRSGKITASGGVSLVDPVRGTLTGDSLVYDLASKQVTLFKARGQSHTQVLSGKGLF